MPVTIVEEVGHSFLVEDEVEKDFRGVSVAAGRKSIARLLCIRSMACRGDFRPDYRPSGVHRCLLEDEEDFHRVDGFRREVSRRDDGLQVEKESLNRMLCMSQPRHFHRASQYRAEGGDLLSPEADRWTVAGEVSILEEEGSKDGEDLYLLEGEAWTAVAFPLRQEEAWKDADLRRRSRTVLISKTSEPIVTW